MDGKILGFDAQSGEGAIRAESGERYKFSRPDWKGSGEPKPGDKVDFVANDGAAKEIYPLKGGMAAPDLSGLGASFSDADKRAEILAAARSNEVVGVFLTKPHVAGAAVIILGWLFTGHLFLLGHVADMHDAMDQIGAFMKGGFAPFRFLGVWIMLALYLIPIYSGWLIYKSFVGKETAKNKRQAALSGLLLPIVVPILSFILIILGLPSQLRDMIFEGASRGFGAARNAQFDFWSMIDIDFGWALMIAGAVLILLQMAGIVTSFGSPPKKAAD